MINFKSSTVFMALLAGACAAPEIHAPPLAFYDPAIPVYMAHCTNGTFTGHGMGYKTCMDRGLERESIARLNGGHDEVYTAAARSGELYTAALK